MDAERAVRRIRGLLVGVAKSAIIRVNRARGREHIPNPYEHIYIEPSSICNLECRFCAYPKKESAKMTMDYDRFCDYVNQATELGYSRFGLTPITGEIFMDKGIFEKLDFLEDHPKVEGYSFYSNVIPLSDSQIERLTSLKKLGTLAISLYGHDASSFSAITQKTDKAYNKLISNLESFEARVSRFQCKLEIGWRTEEFVELDGDLSSDLIDIIRRFRDAHDIPVFLSKSYNNWGGLVGQDDLTGLDIRISKPNSVYKNGACALIFYKLQIMADGRVNGCACRDANATLCIGDLEKDPLGHILSSENEKYMTLIGNQQQGKFNDICHDCDMYRSIYIYDSVYRVHRKPPMTLNEFYATLKERTPRAESPPEDREGRVSS